MAKVFTLNQQPVLYDDSILLIKNSLLGNGWTLQGSGEGTGQDGDFDNTGAVDNVVNTGAGDKSIGNPRAWFRVKNTSHGRELIFQRDASGPSNQLRVKYSYGAGFTGAPIGGGAISESVTPSATDEQILMGTGTDASPSFTTWNVSAENTFVQQMMVEDTGGFWMFTYPNGGGLPTSAMVMDPMVAGTFQALDVDPYMFYFPGTVTPFWYNTIWSYTNSPQSPRGYLAKGLAGEGWVNVPGTIPSDIGSFLHGNIGPNPHSATATENFLPMLYMRRTSQTAPVGWKGQSSYMKWRGSAYTTRDTFDSLGSIAVYDVILDWDSSTTPL